MITSIHICWVCKGFKHFVTFSLM